MPSITPALTNQPSYAIADSKVVLANFKLQFNASDTREFHLTFPNAAPGLAITLSYLGTTGTPRTTIPITTIGGSLPNYGVTVLLTPGATTTDLRCQIQDTGLLGQTDQQFELRATTTANVAWGLSVEGDTNFDVIRIISDAVAHVEPPVAPVIEQETVNLQASDPFVNTVVGSVPWGTSPPIVRYVFGHTGPIVISDLPTASSPTNSTTINLPGVYGPTLVPFTVTVTMSSADPEDTWSFSNTGPGTSTSIESRPQRAVLVIDRSGSMGLDTRWDLAKTSATLFTNLYAEFRHNVNVDDRLGIIAFADDDGWRDPNVGGLPSTLIQTIAPLDKPESVAATLKDPDFGSPGGGTPIGDGLVAGFKMLRDAGLPAHGRYTVILLTDGDENAGTVALKTPVLLPGEGMPKLFTVRREQGDISEISGVATTATKLFALGFGPAPNNEVLSQLVGSTNFVATGAVSSLVNAFGTMLKASQEVNQRLTRDRRVATDGPETKAVFFDTTDAAKLGVGLIGGAGTMEITRWDGGAFVPIAGVTPKDYPGHHYAGVQNGTAFPGEQFWRVRRMVAGVEQTLTPPEVLAYEDLRVKADLILDKPFYLTGDDVNLTVRVRRDFAPLKDVTVRATLDAPAESLGSMLSDLDPALVAKEQRRDNGNKDNGGHDHPTPREALINALLHQHNWTQFPTCDPAAPDGLFIDGTDILHDPDGDGNYTNTFAKVFAEGVYNWQIIAEGIDTEGNRFSQQLDRTVLAKLGVSPKTTIIAREQAPGYHLPQIAVKVTVTPQDIRKHKLGPGFDHTVIWSLKDGKYEHILKQQPAPVNTDGTYTRTVVFQLLHRPKLRVTVNGVLLPVIEVASLFPFPVGK